MAMHDKNENIYIELLPKLQAGSTSDGNYVGCSTVSTYRISTVILQERKEQRKAKTGSNAEVIKLQAFICNGGQTMFHMTLRNSFLIILLRFRNLEWVA